MNKSYESVIGVQVINEVSNNMLKKLYFTNSEVKEFILDSYERYELQTVTKEIFTNGCDIRDSYNVSYYDSLILSAALFCGCKYKHKRYKILQIFFIYYGNIGNS